MKRGTCFNGSMYIRSLSRDSKSPDFWFLLHTPTRYGMTYNHGRPHAWPWQELFVTQMLTRDLFAVANLMVLHIRCVCRHGGWQQTGARDYPTHRQLRLVHHWLCDFSRDTLWTVTWCVCVVHALVSSDTLHSSTYMYSACVNFCVLRLSQY